jgi:hypothetical protein
MLAVDTVCLQRTRLACSGGGVYACSSWLMEGVSVWRSAAEDGQDCVKGCVLLYVVSSGSWQRVL